MVYRTKEDVYRNLLNYGSKIGYMLFRAIVTMLTNNEFSDHQCDVKGCLQFNFCPNICGEVCVLKCRWLGLSVLICFPDFTLCTKDFGQSVNCVWLSGR